VKVAQQLEQSRLQKAAHEEIATVRRAASEAVKAAEAATAAAVAAG